MSGRWRLPWCRRARPRSASAGSWSRSRRSPTSPTGTRSGRSATSRRRSSGCSAMPAEEWYANHELWESSLHEEDRERVLAASERTYTEALDFTCEYRMHAADGRTVWIAERETIVRDDTGRPTSATASCSTSRGSRPPSSGSSPPRRRCARARPGPALPRRGAHAAARDRRRRDGPAASTSTARAAGYPPGALIGCNWFEVAVPAGSRRRTGATSVRRWPGGRRGSTRPARRCW